MKRISTLALAAVCCLAVSAQDLKIKGVLENNRYDDGDQLKTTWIGSLYDENGRYTGKTAYIVDYGIYSMTWNGTSITVPAKDPAVNLSDIKQGSQIDMAKAQWATDFNLMIGNSGAVYADGIITTVHSRDYQSTEDSELFAVRKWDAQTGNLLSGRNDYFPVSANLESAGMAYNPKDGKVYGLFHFTNTPLNQEIMGDEEYFTDQDDQDWGREGLDDGYAIGTIDLKTMTVTQITPGLYYGNFVTFAINSEGRAFAMTSGGVNAPVYEDGKMRDLEGNLTGATLCEFDLTTGLMMTVQAEKTDLTTGEKYTANVNKYQHGTGYASQTRRQAACFAKSNPNKMYWIGFYNSGKGVNSSGSWTTLDNREWRTNGLYDTALYEVDITTGEAERLCKIPNRCSFSCIWIDGDDNSDGSGVNVTGIQEVKSLTADGEQRVYSLSGQQTNARKHGLNIVRNGADVRKVIVK